MVTDCQYCRGTGKARVIAIVGEVSAEAQPAAREKILSAATPADIVICGTDFAQMVCAERGLRHVREREQTPEQMKARADELVDLAAPPAKLENKEAAAARKPVAASTK